VLGLSRKLRVFAYRSPTDMRKSFNTLAALVVELGHEVVAGDAFVFVGKCRRRAKVLWFDGTGLCLLAKRLEKGRFARLWERAELTSSELVLFLEGNETVGRLPLSPEAFSIERDGRVEFSPRGDGSTSRERR
jgi:transposase